MFVLRRHERTNGIRIAGEKVVFPQFSSTVTAAGIEERDGFLFEGAAWVAFVFNAVG
ncbi:MAG: hypothetical protein LBQ81_01325 [Zoogloeaceae bacterium]|jgi:hypothetical protein|nr:hypothetical protein [Zoogloeaceae bacterium]